MGLAASQARFLGLTARKSNVEYQGQQINQARTALSNEVMGLYNEYNNLDVPIPPNINDYQKVTYTLDSTYEKYQIDNFTKITDGPYAGYYNVVLSYEDEIAKSYPYTAKDSVVTSKKEDGEYTYLSFQLGMQNYIYDANDPDISTITKITENYEQYPGLTTIMQEQGLSEGTFYMFVNNGVAYYTSETDLNATAFETIDDKDIYYGSYTFNYAGAQKKHETVNAIAALTQESSGRLATIQVLSCEDDPDLINNTYSIKTGSADDQMAYNDAMNDYNYKKDLYEKEVKRINQKTEKIQAEDRSLELKLNQLDTEQKAISTEMDSISEVIKNTIDSVFKTFNS